MELNYIKKNSTNCINDGYLNVNANIYDKKKENQFVSKVLSLIELTLAVARWSSYL